MEHIQVLVLFLSCFVISVQDVTSQHDGVPDERDYHIPEGSSQILNCSQSGAPAVPTWRNVTWILPNLTLIARDHVTEFEEGTSFRLEDEGEILQIINIQPQWYGDYYCIVIHMEPNFYVTKFGINASYLYDADIYNQYHKAILVLAIVCSCFLALLTLIVTVIIWCRKSHKLSRDLSVTSQQTHTEKDNTNNASYLGPEVIDFTNIKGMDEQTI